MGPYKIMKLLTRPPKVGTILVDLRRGQLFLGKVLSGNKSLAANWPDGSAAVLPFYWGRYHVSGMTMSPKNFYMSNTIPIFELSPNELKLLHKYDIDLTIKVLFEIVKTFDPVDLSRAILKHYRRATPYNSEVCAFIQEYNPSFFPISDDELPF